MSTHSSAMMNPAYSPPRLRDKQYANARLVDKHGDNTDGQQQKEGGRVDPQKRLWRPLSRALRKCLLESARA